MDKKKKKPIFARKESSKKSRLGHRRKKKLKWRRQKGKHNKIRARMRGYLRQPSIGFGSDKRIFQKINNLKPVIIYNLDDLKKVKQDELVILAHTSKKNKIKIAKKAQEMGIKIYNLKKNFLGASERELKNKIKAPKNDSIKK